MKKQLQRILFSVIVLSVISFTAAAQTPVSGGIYSNTTWTLTNSPYIVTADIVVFPGVTLTIQPGVTVKFDNGKQLEIRQAKLIAQGTATDSIIFTSSSASPTPGIWDRIYFNQCNDTTKFKYCRFSYAQFCIYYASYIILKNSLIKMCSQGLQLSYAIVDSCVFTQNPNAINGVYKGLITNSIFKNNGKGINTIASEIINCRFCCNAYGIFQTESTLVRDCIIDSNTVYGLETEVGNTIIENQIKNNAIGIQYEGGDISKNIIEFNNIGIKISISSPNTANKVFCNKICNNTSYGISNNISTPFSVSNNYWCTNDSSIVSTQIYDGYDNTNYGLITFMPIDTGQCYLSGCNLLITATTTPATCDTCHNGSATAHVTYGIPPYTYTWYTTPLQTSQTATGLAPGTYTVCVVDAMGCSACNYNVYVDSTNCTGFSIAAHGNNSTCSTCNDGTAGVTVTGGTPPFTYSWYTSPMQNTAAVNNLLPGTYGVCVADVYGCVSCDSVTINTGNCSAHFDLYPDSIQLHQYYAVNMASGVPPLTYLWHWGDGTTSTGPYPTHTYATAGFYAICLDITDAVGCTNQYCNSYYLQKSTNTMVTITVISQTTTGINDLSSGNSFIIYPNPSNGLVNISFPETTIEVRVDVLNSCGQVILSKDLNNLTQTTLDLSNNAKGLYFIKVQSGSGVVVRKVVISE